MKIDKHIATAAFLLLTYPACAGPLGGALTYIQGNLLTDLETLAIIGLAVTLFAMQIRWQFVLGICAGIWVMANPDIIRGALSGG